MAGGVGREQNYWPGFVDALSNLVLVVIFVLIVFTLALFFFASRVGNKTADMAQAKAKEVIAAASNAQAGGGVSPTEIQKPGVKLEEIKQQNAQMMAETAQLLQQLKQDLSLDQKQKFEQKIQDLEEKIKATEIKAGDVDAESKLNSRTVLQAVKNVTDTPKGAQVLPGRAGLNNGEVLIVTYNPGVVEIDPPVVAKIDKVLAPFNPATIKVDLLAQPSDESYSEAQRLSYYRLVSMRNYLLRKGVSSDRMDTRIVERLPNPEIKPGAVFVRITSK